MSWAAPLLMQAVERRDDEEIVFDGSPPTRSAVRADFLAVVGTTEVHVSVYSNVLFRPVLESTEADDDSDVVEALSDSTFENVNDTP